MGQSQSCCKPNVYEENYPQPPPPVQYYHHHAPPPQIPVVPNYSVQYYYPQPVFPVTFYR